jgi:hypothetical protein
LLLIKVLFLKTNSNYNNIAMRGLDKISIMSALGMCSSYINPFRCFVPIKTYPPLALIHSQSYSITHRSLSNNKIAIFGGGLGGLGIAHYLTNLNYAVTVYDECLVGEGGASAVSAGLCHPFNSRCNLLWHGEESFNETIKLLDFLEMSESKSLRISDAHIIRPCKSKKELEAYRQACTRLSSVSREFI